MVRRSRSARNLRQHHIAAAPAEPGLYRTVTGAESLSVGLVAGAQLAGLPMFFGGYPITPASAMLHHLSRLKEYGITTFQAEDEIAAICAAIGASYAGSIGGHLFVGSRASRSRARRSGWPIMTELPLVIVNSQRGGPIDRLARPRPSSPTSIRRSMAATAMPRCR